MQALIVIDAQNEFSSEGQRPVPDHENILNVIRGRIREARTHGEPIAWVRHHNRPEESPAFRPDTWGAEFSPGCGPKQTASPEKEFQKNVYGAFTGTNIGEWLEQQNVDTVLIVGFYTFGCVSTTAREAIMKKLNVLLDPNATGACEITHPTLGILSAPEACRTALIQLAAMGATIIGS
ncbi:MAG TPA: isochorismatase family cysteine hydrolase [Puia sp.]|jgi:nicotinamidase-related amidase|nr:isochorismatase family cysteine hydrolase [Puia sp.]